MTFINGYPTGESVKLPLHTVEPSQLSDLVAVPIWSMDTFNVRTINHGVNPPVKSDRDIQKVNYPFSIYPCLFQRYNPHGLTFADGYSTKLYYWLRKYSHLYLLGKTPLVTLDADITKAPILVDHPIGKTIKVKLPDNGRKITYSYYYPELINRELTLGTSFTDFILLPPERMSEWRSAMPPSGEKPIHRNSAYEYSKIDNECIHVPVTRSWLLSFNTVFCQGQEIELDEDILIASLVLSLENLEQEEIEFILSQIPECYLYSYLETFLNKIDDAILQSIPTVFEIKQATEISFNINFEYEINHKLNSIERIKDKGYQDLSDGSRCYLKSATYELIPDAKFFISAAGSNEPEIEFTKETIISDAFRFGKLVYANNNFWNNYEFNLEDLGEIQLSIDSYSEVLENKHSIIFNYLGNLTQRDYLPATGNTKVIGYDGATENYKIDSFNQNGYDSGNLFFAYAFELKLGYKDFAHDYYNHEVTRLLYDSASNFPEMIASVGNELDYSLYTVEAEDRDSGYYLRGNTTKVFRIFIDLNLVNVNYIDEFSDYISPNYFTERVEDKTILGEVDYSYDLFGQTHPVATYISNSEGYSKCERDTYYQGFWQETPLNGIVNSTSQPNIIYRDSDEPFKQIPIRSNNFSTIPIGRGSVEGNTAFNISSLFDKTFKASLVPATEIKKLRAFKYDSSVFEYITQAHLRCEMATCDLEDIKKLLQEIHAALAAGKYAYRDGSEETARDWNLGEMIEATATVNGLSFNSDNSIRSIRQGELIKQGNSIPAGWNFGQFGRNQGGSTEGQTGGNPNETRYGIAYEVRSNVFTNDDFTGKTNAIEQGGIVLCENIPQLLHFVLQDVDRALGMQDMGANVLPTPNGGVASYQGLNQMILDSLYTLSQLSKQISSINVLSLKSQAMQQEILSGFGLPIGIKEIEIADSSGVVGVLPFPGFDLNAPTLTDIIGLNLLNTGSLIGSQMQVTGNSEEDNPETEE